jgi:DNA-directed RNA polymerase alpha subunit
MTFVADLLQHAHDGKCPICSTQVVVQVERFIYSEEWANEDDLSRLQEFRIDELGMSVRTTMSLTQMGVDTIGQLLEINKSDIRNAFQRSESIIMEIGKLLDGKGLSLE